MISRLLYALQTAFTYLQKQPQIVLALLLLVIVPLLFLYSGQAFLDAGTANQDRIQRDKIGLLHDAFVSMGRATSSKDFLQAELTAVAAINPDITKFRVTKLQGTTVVPIAALDQSVIGMPEPDVSLYQSATVRFDESLIFEMYQGDDRIWQAFRSIQSHNNEVYFIFTEHNLAAIDTTILINQWQAYKALAVVYVLILIIAYWQIRNTDYRYLYKEAKQANETKALFTNMIAHELRAPLTAIRGYASMMEETQNEVKDTKSISSIRVSADRLLAIVNDLLDVARIQSGKMSVDLGDTDLSVVINAALDELRISAKEKGITLVSVGTDATQRAYSDEKRLHQVLTNLVSNAIKYTKDGRIEVALESKRSNYEIRIKDTGMGISAEEQKELFAPFYRVASNDVSTITGTGLGMWITKQLVDLLEATIAVESIKGVGTHIIIKLPKAAKK